MKRILVILSTIVLTGPLYAQVFDEPQYFFYGSNFPSKADLDSLYRLYEIEQTSVISYETYSVQPLPFQCRDSVLSYREVDFGAPLVKQVFYPQNIFVPVSQGKLYFAGPVHQIDPAIFDENVTDIRFPMTDNITYISSPEIRVDNLAYMEGKDVREGAFLIAKDGTLIVCALEFFSDTIFIPEGVLAVGAGAFRGYGAYMLKSQPLVLPPSVQYIGDKAFEFARLSAIYFRTETIPQFGQEVFGTTPDPELTLYVPRKQLKAYKKQFPKLKKRIRTY